MHNTELQEELLGELPEEPVPDIPATMVEVFN